MARQASPAPPTISHDTLVRAAQIDAHYRLLPVVLVVNAIVPPIFFVFAQDGIDLRRAAIWQVAFILVLGARIGLRTAFLRRRPDALRTLRWGHWATAGSCATGIMWGLVSLILWPANPAGQLLLGATLAGMTAGAVSALAPYFPPFVAYVPTSLLPFVGVSILYGPRVTVGAGILTALFMIAMLTMARILNRNFIESLHLRFENTELLRDLTVQRQAADAANRAKTDFIAAVSHDLRQPVHALGLFTTTLSERTTDPDVRKIVQKMDRSIRAIQHLFTALLDVSRLEAGVIRPRPRDFSLQSLLDRIALDLEGEADARHLELRIRPTRAVVHSDPALIEIVLRNLVGNALAHAQRGRVLVACRGQGSELCIEVWDQGVGIPAEHQARIFEDYYRVVDTTTTPPDRAHVGLGLGIVMRVVRVLRHGIELRSTPGVGTMFRLRLPRGAPLRASRADPSVRPPIPLAGIFVVVIDDDDTILQAMNALLRTWGCRVVIACTVTDAVVRLADEPGVPDLLIVDYRLGRETTGVDAARILHEEYNTDIPILLITAETDQTILREFERDGTLVLCKPIAGEHLHDAIGAVLQVTNAGVSNRDES